jgi:hypothetical protein
MCVCMYDLGSTEGRRSIADCLTGIPLLGECRRAEVEGLCVCVCVCVCVVHVFSCMCLHAELGGKDGSPGRMRQIDKTNVHAKKLAGNIPDCC